MTTTLKIASCKFCGDTASSYIDKSTFWHVTCDGNNDEECRGIDHGESNLGYTLEDYAIEAWNKIPADYVDAGG